MFINSRLHLLLLVPFLCTPLISTPQNHSVAHPGDRIYLDVVVSPVSGSLVGGLQQQDFTILDNNVSQTIASFEAVDGRQATTEVVLVLDAVNTESREAAIEHQEISKFLKANGGRLGYPTAVAILTDNGLHFQGDFSQDGNAISSPLGHYTIPCVVSTETRIMARRRNASGFHFKDLQNSWRANATGLGASSSFVSLLAGHRFSV